MVPNSEGRPGLGVKIAVRGLPVVWIGDKVPFPVAISVLSNPVTLSLNVKVMVAV